MRCASLRDGKCSALSTVFKLCHFNPRQRWPFQKAAFGSETNTSKALELVGLSRYYLFLVIAKALLRFSLQQLFDELATRTERQLKRMFKFAQGAAHLWDVHEIRMAKRERQLEVTPLRSLPLSRCRSSFHFCRVAPPGVPSLRWRRWARDLKIATKPAEPLQHFLPRVFSNRVALFSNRKFNGGRGLYAGYSDLLLSKSAA